MSRWVTVQLLIDGQCLVRLHHAGGYERSYPVCSPSEARALVKRLGFSGVVIEG